MLCRSQWSKRSYGPEPIPHDTLAWAQILTTYPPDLPDRGVTDETPVLCGSHWSERGILTFTAAKLRPAPRPRPVPFTAAGFIFTRGRRAPRWGAVKDQGSRY